MITCIMIRWRDTGAEVHRIYFPTSENITEWLVDLKEFTNTKGGAEVLTSLMYHGNSQVEAVTESFILSEVVYSYIRLSAEKQTWPEQRLGRKPKFCQQLMTRTEMQTGSGKIARRT